MGRVTPRKVTSPSTRSVFSPVRSMRVEWKVICGKRPTSKKSPSFSMLVCWTSSIWMLAVLTSTSTRLCRTSASSTFTVPFQSVKLPVVRKTLELPMAKSMEPKLAPILRFSTAAAGPAMTSASSTGRAPRAQRLKRINTLLVGLEEPPAGAALVLVDRALVIGRRQRHADGCGHHARLDRGFAQHHAAVELVEVGHAKQRPGVGGGVFVQQEPALAVGSVERRAMYQSDVVDGHRARRP